MKLNPGMEAEYRKRHDEIWPELVELLHKSGASDYSIHLDRETNTLFGVLTRPKDHTMASLPEHPAHEKVVEPYGRHHGNKSGQFTPPERPRYRLPHAMSKPPGYRRIAVLDIGKTNAKVVVLDSHNRHGNRSRKDARNTSHPVRHLSAL